MEKQKKFIQDFNELDDWFMQYAYLVEMSADIEPLQNSEKTDENLVPGCQSKLWLTLAHKNGRVKIKADSDALIVKGMVGVCVHIMNDQPPEEIRNAEITFIEKTPIKIQISSDRFKGLESVIEKIKRFSAQC